MLTLKLMSEQDLPDDNTAKDFTLVQIGDKDVLKFLRTGESGVYREYTCKVIALVTLPDGSEECYPLVGNAYVMNANGKTIASRASF